MRNRGEKNYQKCQNKVVTMRRGNGLLVGADLECPRTENDEVVVRVSANQVVKSMAKDIKVGVWDVEIKKKDVRCVQYMGVEQAYKHIQKVAGEIACKDCQYADKTPLEASSMLADKAEASLAVAENELRRSRALEARKLAMDEIREIEARSSTIDPTFE